MWRTQTFNANSFATDIGTQVNSTTIRPMLNPGYGQMSPRRPPAGPPPDVAGALRRLRRGDGGDPAHHHEHQRPRQARLPDPRDISGSETGAEIVFGGGKGSLMPANTTFLLETDSLRMRYNPNRNFDTLFKGEGQMPINQDAIAQFVGWMGELTMVNPLFNGRFYDSNPAA